MTLGFPFGLLLVGLLGGKPPGPKDLTTRPPGKKPRPEPTAPPPPGATPAAPTPVITPASYPGAAKTTPAPWPQVVPAGLPPFPGADWVPDNPPGTGVVARASQLLPTLWAHGAGTFRTEQTSGRWITYRATAMGAKRGVVAFRLREPQITVHPAEVQPTPTTPHRPPSMPGMPEYDWTSPANVPHVVPASTPAVGLTTLRLKSPRMVGPDVMTLQRRLGLSADGVFGSGTHAAVVAYQTGHGLTPDGVVGPKTWGSLFGSSQA